MRNGFLASVALAALIGSPAAAATLVSTINGAYDDPNGDTINLNINNPTGFDFTNAQIVLKGYGAGTDNVGITQTVQLGTIGAGTNDLINWGNSASNGFAVPNSFAQSGVLFTGDYDDSYGAQIFNPACAAQGFGYCAFVGNFQVTFTATWANPAYNGGAGTEISSVFSPANNATGSFVGFEGLDPSGLSETVYDAHQGSISGTLANIYVGAPTGGVPEPATWALMLGGLGAIGSVLRRKAAVAPAIA